MANGRNLPVLGAGGGATPHNNPNPAGGGGHGGGGGGAPRPPHNDAKGTALGVVAGVGVLLLIVGLLFGCAGLFTGGFTLSAFLGGFSVAGIAVVVLLAVVAGIGSIAALAMSKGGDQGKSTTDGKGSADPEFPTDMPWIRPCPWAPWLKLGPEQQVLSRSFTKSRIRYGANEEVVDVEGFALHGADATFFLPWLLLLQGHYPVAILDSSKPEPWTVEVNTNTRVDKIKVLLQISAWWDRHGGVISAVRLATAREGQWKSILNSLAQRCLNSEVSGDDAQTVENEKVDIGQQVTAAANEEATDMGVETRISILEVSSSVRTEAHEAEERASAEARGKVAGYQQLLENPAAQALLAGVGDALSGLGEAGRGLHAAGRALEKRAEQDSEQDS